jgi:hypothetical protein
VLLAARSAVERDRVHARPAMSRHSRQLLADRAGSRARPAPHWPRTTSRDQPWPRIPRRYLPVFGEPLRRVGLCSVAADDIPSVSDNSAVKFTTQNWNHPCAPLPRVRSFRARRSWAGSTWRGGREDRRGRLGRLWPALRVTTILPGRHPRRRGHTGRAGPGCHVATGKRRGKRPGGRPYRPQRTMPSAPQQPGDIRREQE